MPDRAGPPTPRNEPYSATDIAFDRWLEGAGLVNTAYGQDIGSRAMAKVAFRAGWYANQEQNKSEPCVDLRCKQCKED